MSLTYHGRSCFDATTMRSIGILFNLMASASFPLCPRPLDRVTVLLNKRSFALIGAFVLTSTIWKLMLTFILDHP